jgi:hypothetical protein
MKSLFIATLLLFSVAGFSQDTTKVEQYCRLVAFNKILSNKVNIDVDFGEERKFFSDTRLRDEETGKVKKFNTLTDALNYMGSQGWTLVNAYPVTEGSSVYYYFYFRKLFRKDEVR